MGIIFSSFNGLEPKIRFVNFKENYRPLKIGDIYAERSERGAENMELLSVTINEGVKKRMDIDGKDTSSEDKSNYKIVHTGDMVYNSMRMWQGANGISDYDGIVSPAYTVLKSKGNIHNQYIGFLFKNSELINKFRKNSQGLTSDTWNLKYPQIACIKINIPSLDEQQKIADFLSLVDQRIEKQRQLVESLKKYKRGLFLKLYNDSDKSIMLFKNIYKVASEGGTPSTLDTENYKNGKLPFIKIDDLYQHYLTSAKYFITEKGLKKSSAWLVPENSIIYSNGATIGACSINKIPVTTKQGILGIVPKSNFSVEFLYFFFTSSLFKEKIRAITTKGTMDCAYLKDINDIKISIPDFTVQQKISKIMVDFENLIEYTEFSLMHLHNIKKGLLQQMFI